MSIILGIVAAFVGATPFVLSDHFRKIRLQNGKETSVAFMAFMPAVSFVIMTIEIVVCAVLCKDALASFGVAMIFTFVLAVLCLTIIKVRTFMSKAQ